MTVSPYLTLIAPSVDSNKQDKVPLTAQFKYTFLGQTQLFFRALEATMTWQLNNTHDVHPNYVERGVKNRQKTFVSTGFLSMRTDGAATISAMNNLLASMAVNSRADPNT